jgi:hypothetical protein
MRLKAEIIKIFYVFRTHILAGVGFEPTTFGLLTTSQKRTKLKFQHMKLTTGEETIAMGLFKRKETKPRKQAR